MLRAVVILLLVAPLAGCYYMQAAAGQWEVLRKREPLEEVIDDPDTPPELAARLRLLDEARDFSIARLGLPDNRSYRSYTDLERDYVVWNVFAAPELSLQAKTWCFPVVGCVSYRGYFAREDAVAMADRLKKQRYDVALGGVAAYSTLGNFDDPILSTMMHWDDTRLAAVLFHELAHQVIYVKNDSAFNESFATAVEEFGVQQWLKANGQSALFDAYREQRDYQQRLADIVGDFRGQLAQLFDSDLPPGDKREGKRRILASLLRAIEAEAERSAQKMPGWASDQVNNAHLISISLYEGYLPAFRQIRAGCDDMPCFYAAARRLAELDAASRHAELERLNRNAPGQSAGRKVIDSVSD